MKKINLIVAVGNNNVIGYQNRMPGWVMKRDMHFFSQITTGEPIEENVLVMGRKNFDSLPERYRPLPNRKNIVVTRNALWDPKHPEVEIAHSLEEAIKKAQQAKGDIWIIGGGEIYAQALQTLPINEIYVTHIEGNFEGDVFFPQLDETVYSQKELVVTFSPEWKRNTHNAKVLRYTKA